MIEHDIEEGLIIQPVERRGAPWILIFIWGLVGFGLILGGILSIHYLFEKKIWI